MHSEIQVSQECFSNDKLSQKINMETQKISMYNVPGCFGKLYLALHLIKCTLFLIPRHTYVS